MPKIIISDTSCLITLANINEMELLNRIYGKIFITPDINEEFGEQIPDWIEIILLKDKSIQRILELQLDRGEASAIAVAIETPNSVLILDDYKARKVAGKLGINYTGTLGIIIKAKRLNLIKSIKPYIIKLKEADFRLSKELEQEAIKEAGEQF